MKIMKKWVLSSFIYRVVFLYILLIFVGCNKVSTQDIAGVYEVDKVSISNNNTYHYLTLRPKNTYTLKKLNGDSITNHYHIENKGWESIKFSFPLEKEKITKIKFNFHNQIVMGELKGNILYFIKPNVFDNRDHNWIYVKTNRNIQ